jgi:(p)ppGpp synthase/HD superfamily hydrolase
MDANARARLADALVFALEVHGNQTRKGKEIPYVSHLLQVAGLVLEHGGDWELAVAGLLHDSIEDCEEVTFEVLRKRFGAKVARIVASCSDLLEGDTPDRKAPWTLRKRRYLAHLAQADAAVRLVSACDKLDNLRSIIADLGAEGVATLERFRATPAQTRWYYESVREVLAPDLPERLRREMDALLAELRRFVGESSPEP